MEARKPSEKPTKAPDIADYKPGTWFKCHTVDEMQAFYMSRLPAIREAAKLCGYAIGLHGSTRRDLDLIAMPWSGNWANHNDLAIAVQTAACGFAMTKYQWETKHNLRIATCFPICWTEWNGMISAGHIDLSVAVLPGAQP